jgi:hypothetical protein
MSEPMREAYAGTGEMAKSGGAETGINFSVSGNVSPLQISITEFFKTQYPRKTWAFLSDLLGIGERVAKHRMANTRAYTIEELQLMLQSEDGLSILETLMAEAEPAWWQWIRKTMKLADARRKQAEIQQEVLLLETSGPIETGSRRRLKGIRDADKRISAALAEKETDLGAVHPNRNRPSHSAVAQAQGEAQPGSRTAGRRR